MKALFDKVSLAASRNTTKTYSTSFSLGIHCLQRRFHDPIYAIYGFVRFADEIVDSFHEYNKRELLDEFTAETWKAIARGISMNPIINSFQHAVRSYNIHHDLIRAFLHSMEMDLEQHEHSRGSYEEYILGSAEVVGLMCLAVFTEGDRSQYEKLKPSAMRLGAAFQKVNFLRDMRADYHTLGRIYFPGVDLEAFTPEAKLQIEEEIRDDFREALQGIRQLPAGARFGVYVAYVYYRRLFLKIKRTAPERIMNERIRIPNYQKIALLAGSFFRHNLYQLGMSRFLI